MHKNSMNWQPLIDTFQSQSSHWLDVFETVELIDLENDSPKDIRKCLDRLSEIAMNNIVHCDKLVAHFEK